MFMQAGASLERKGKDPKMGSIMAEMEVVGW